MKPTVVITGGSGLLAVNWAMAVRDDYQVILGLHRRAISVSDVNARIIELESVDGLLQTLEKLQPELVIHTAGLTSVEDCEADPELAEHVNVTLAANVAQACAAFAVPLVHISTDHLFAGNHAFVDEQAPTSPINVYAQTKAEAEVRVLSVYPGALVVRTNFYAWGPSYRYSFSDMIVESLRAGEEVTLFEDVFFTPILVDTLVDAVHKLVALRCEGIIHLVGDERISKLGFGQKLASTFGIDANLIAPGLLSEQEQLVQRPHDMSLSNQKAVSLLGDRLGDVTTQLEQLRQQELNGNCGEMRQL